MLEISKSNKLRWRICAQKNPNCPDHCPCSRPVLCRVVSRIKCGHSQTKAGLRRISKEERILYHY